MLLHCAIWSNIKPDKQIMNVFLNCFLLVTLWNRLPVMNIQIVNIKIYYIPEEAVSCHLFVITVRSRNLNIHFLALVFCLTCKKQLSKIELLTGRVQLFFGKKNHLTWHGNSNSFNVLQNNSDVALGRGINIIEPNDEWWRNLLLQSTVYVLYLNLDLISKHLLVKFTHRVHLFSTFRLLQWQITKI